MQYLGCQNFCSALAVWPVYVRNTAFLTMHCTVHTESGSPIYDVVNSFCVAVLSCYFRPYYQKPTHLETIIGITVDHVVDPSSLSLSLSYVVLLIVSGHRATNYINISLYNFSRKY